MDLDERVKIVQSVGEEIVTIAELRELLQTKSKFVAYDGFEPSGKIHIAQGLLRAININKMTKAGARFKMLVADWHAWANNKMSGDLEKIKTTGEYFIEVWKACGLDTNSVEFVWASELLNNRDYWKTVVQVGRHSTLNRVIRTMEILGRSEKDLLHASQIIYPCMQAADIFHLGADVCQLGMDQRKVNVLAREIGPNIGYWKPVIVSHHMMLGLQKPLSSNLTAEERIIQMKMSKSKPDTAIFMTDTIEEVSRKINNAYCPEKQIEENPVLEYCKYIIFESFKHLKIERDKKYGGDIYVESFAELDKLYSEGNIHPLDLKRSVSLHINQLLDPVRKHFEKNKKARELLDQVKEFEVTR